MTAADAQADARELGTIGVDARRFGPGRRSDSTFSNEIDDALLQGGYEVANADLFPPNVDQRVNHQDAGAVVGHLAATVDLHYRDVPRREQVLSRGIETQREHGRVFAEPDFVLGRVIAFVGEALHGLPAGDVVLAAEEARLHSAIRTSSLAVTSR